jgi:uncharacterized protein YjhX (UPF0386 family)
MLDDAASISLARCSFSAALAESQMNTAYSYKHVTFGTFRHSKNGVCSYTISRLCLFQAVLLLAQHYTMHLTTDITALKCQSRKGTQVIATVMSLFDTFTHSKNGVYSYTISRLCLFQAVLPLAQHYTMRLTAVITALKCQMRKQTQFIATDMTLFEAFKHSTLVQCASIL